MGGEWREGREGGREEGREGGRKGGRKGDREAGREEGGGEGRRDGGLGREGGGGREGGRELGEGGMILRNNVSRRSIVPREQWYVITFDVTWTSGVSESLTNKLPELVFKLILSIPVLTAN